jgi:hypothetical protein
MLESTVKRQIYQIIAELSTEKLNVLLQFLKTFLSLTPQNGIILRGIWQDIDFEITQDDVRSLRQTTTQHTKERLDAIFS